MTTPALAAVAAAVFMAPTPSYGAVRLRAVRDDAAAAGLRWTSLAGRPIAAAAVVACIAVVAVGGVAAVAGTSRAIVVPGLAAACVGALAGWLSSHATAARRERRLQASLVSAVAALPAELRAGQSEAAALRSVASAADPELAVALQAAGAAAAMAGDVADTLRLHAEQSALPSVVRSGLLRLAAAWAVSRDSGAPIASVLDRVDGDLRAYRRRNQQVEAQLAGPRATAVLLSLLPALGVALGAATGAHPVGVLLGTPAGQAALLLGLFLDVAGVLWTVRIVRATGMSP